MKGPSAVAAVGPNELGPQEIAYHYHRARREDYGLKWIMDAFENVVVSYPISLEDHHFCFVSIQRNIRPTWQTPAARTHCP